MLGTPLTDEQRNLNRRKQFAFEEVECKAKASEDCKGYTVRIRGRSRHEKGVCSSCNAELNHRRRAEWKEAKASAGVPRSAAVMAGVKEGCEVCTANYERITGGEFGYTRCPDHG